MTEVVSTRPSGRYGTIRRALDSSIVYRILALAIFAAIWQYATVSTRSLLIPTFLQTVAAIPGLLLSQELWRAMVTSNLALVLGFGLAILIGVPVGLLMGRFRGAERFANVYINILLVPPVAALIPLLLMSVGIGLA